MPNRSTGCYLCRSRKIRCDGQRPSCQRCQTHGVPCPGYKIVTPGDVEFRDETQLAAKRSGENRAPGVLQKRNFRATQTPRNGGLTSSKSPSTPSSSGRLPHVALVTFNSPAANRAQFYSNFFDIFTPKNVLSHERGGSVQTSNFGYLSHLGSLPGSNPALTHGMSALSLVSVGSLRKDGDLLRKGIEEYTTSLRMLSAAIQQPETLHDDNVIATITILKLCEFYDEINRNSNGWINHSDGLQRILAARGSEDLTGELPAMLLANAKQASLTRSVLARRRDFYDSPEWTKSNFESLSHDVGTQLPSLMARHDRINLKRPSASQDINDLFDDCSQLEQKLKAYLDHEVAASLHSSGNRYVRQNIEAFSPFAELVTDRTVTTAYSFPSFASAFLHTSFWIRMYFLRSTMASLQSYQRILSSDTTSNDEANQLHVEETELESYIIHLCCSIPFFIDPKNGTIGHICCFFPMVAAAKYFQEHGPVEWLRWIHHVRDRVFDKGISLPSIEGAEIPTLDI